jgi:DNA (cytosine-5)-methyltransferase 1
MKQDMTMGSLFSGSGGFELAASIFEIKPLWASEIEPFPIMVTATNFPEMEHLGIRIHTSQ